MENILGNHLTSFADHLNAQYGERSTPAREEFEIEFEKFKNEVMQPQKTRKSNSFFTKLVS